MERKRELLNVGRIKRASGRQITVSSQLRVLQRKRWPTAWPHRNRDRAESQQRKEPPLIRASQQQKEQVVSSCPWGCASRDRPTSRDAVKDATPVLGGRLDLTMLEVPSQRCDPPRSGLRSCPTRTVLRDLPWALGPLSHTSLVVMRIRRGARVSCSCRHKWG